MNEEQMPRYGALWRQFLFAVGVLVVVGSFIGFSPVWWGDWSEASVVLWLGTVARMALIVWLGGLAAFLWRVGHELHGALVIGLLMPLVSGLFRSASILDAGPVATVKDALDRYMGGKLGLIALASAVSLALVATIGRRTSWRYFRTLGPERLDEPGQ